MYESGYYPMGADNEYAPWREAVPPERKFNVCVSQTLSKNTEVVTTNYLPEYDDEDGKTYYDTLDTDWKEAYAECSYTPLELIELFKKYLEEHLPDPKDKGEYRRAKELISECSNWVEDDFEVVEN